MSQLASDVVVNDQYDEVADLSLLAVDQYLREVRWIKRLSDEEVLRLLYQVYRGRCERENASPNQWRLRIAAHAREQLVESYQPLILFIARHRVFSYRSMELLDVVQEGNLGFLLALEQWTPAVKDFTPFAWMCISQAMWKSLYTKDRAIAVSEQVRDELSKLSRLITKLSAALDQYPTPQEIGQEMGVSAKRVSDLLFWRREACVESIEAVRARQIAPDREPFCSLYGGSAEEETPVALRQVIAAALDMLTSQQRAVIEARYCFGEGLTERRDQKHVAELLGITRAVVSKRELVALKHIAFFLAPLAAAGRPSVRSVGQVQAYYTTKEVCTLLGLSPSEVAARAQSGELTALRHGGKWYFPQPAIDTLMGQRGNEGAADVA